MLRATGEENPWMNMKSLSQIKGQRHKDIHAYIIHLCRTLLLKVRKSYFSKLSSLLYIKSHHSKDVNLQIKLKGSSHLDVQSNFVYYSCLYFTLLVCLWLPYLGMFSSKSSRWNCSTVKFIMRYWYEKNTTFLMVPNFKRFDEKVEKQLTWLI